MGIIDQYVLIIFLKNLLERMINMKKPTCKLIGQDGNVFNLLSKVSKVLKQNNLYKQEKEMTEKVFNCKSYDEALRIFSDYVEIE